MAQEYGALLKWPKDKEEDLAKCKGKPSILVLQLELRNLPTETHTIELSEGWGYDECYEACFEFIRPVKLQIMKGSILSLNLKENN